ncbi:MAG: serine protein kinase RIO [Candidatus Aenigmatarchaeota archaeon]
MEFFENFKIERKVFDRRTILAILKLMNKGYIRIVESLIKEGKESCVLSGKDKKENWIVLKIYRIEYCDFKNMWKYLITDPRFSGIKKDRRSIVHVWCRREFKNLKIASDAGVSCPKPIAFFENVLVMEFIGKNGNPAPRLIDVSLNSKEAQNVYESIIEEVKKLLKAKLVHSDLSAFNILFFEKPYLIDFSQAVTLSHPLAEEFLKRDLKNISSYFKKIGIPVKSEEEIIKEFI